MRVRRNAKSHRTHSKRSGRNLSGRTFVVPSCFLRPSTILIVVCAYGLYLGYCNPRKGHIAPHIAPSILSETSPDLLHHTQAVVPLSSLDACSGQENQTTRVWLPVRVLDKEQTSNGEDTRSTPATTETLAALVVETTKAAVNKPLKAAKVRVKAAFHKIVKVGPDCLNQ